MLDEHFVVMDVAYLHLDIKNAYFALLGDVLHRLYAGTIHIAAELRVLDEAIVVNELLEGILGGEVIFATVLFARSGRARSIYGVLVRFDRTHAVSIVREIENPKRSGNSLKRRPRRVDLPEPDGPDTTIGLFC